MTSWYTHDQRTHGELRRRAAADNTVEQIKQSSGTYGAIELVRGDSARDEDNRGAKRSMKLKLKENTTR